MKPKAKVAPAAPAPELQNFDPEAQPERAGSCQMVQVSSEHLCDCKYALIFTASHPRVSHVCNPLHYALILCG